MKKKTFWQRRSSARAAKRAERKKGKEAAKAKAAEGKTTVAGEVDQLLSEVNFRTPQKQQGSNNGSNGRGSEFRRRMEEGRGREAAREAAREAPSKNEGGAARFGHRHSVGPPAHQPKSLSVESLSQPASRDMHGIRPGFGRKG